MPPSLILVSTVCLLVMSACRLLASTSGIFSFARPSPLKLALVACLYLVGAGRWTLRSTDLVSSESAVRAVASMLGVSLPALPIPALPDKSVPNASVPTALTDARTPDVQSPDRRFPDTRPSIIRDVLIPPVLVPVLNESVSASLPSVITPASGAEVAMAIPAQRPPLVPLPRMPARPLPGVLALPAGTGPFPAVILLHGCGGPFSAPPPWAYRLNRWGYAVLMPDSMTPRGVRTVCDPADQPKVTARDRIGDVGAAASWLRSRPEIDPARIAVLGLSHGGATAALAVQTPYAAIRLRAAIDYYGPCAHPELQGATPLLVLAGTADDWGDPAARCQAYGDALRPDQPFEIHTYPGAYHAFDSGPATKTMLAGHVLAFDKEAAEDSFNRVHAFLDREVKF